MSLVTLGLEELGWLDINNTLGVEKFGWLDVIGNLGNEDLGLLSINGTSGFGDTWVDVMRLQQLVHVNIDGKSDDRTCCKRIS